LFRGIAHASFVDRARSGRRRCGRLRTNQPDSARKHDDDLCIQHDDVHVDHLVIDDHDHDSDPDDSLTGERRRPSLLCARDGWRGEVLGRRLRR
jgi:hypothetical protein